MFKNSQVKCHFKIHTGVVFLDKNVNNPLENKYILSLGYDDRVEPEGHISERALIFKIWDYTCLHGRFFYFLSHLRSIDYVEATETCLTGGTIW